ncbi:MAG TPA: DUF2851 family protein [Flavobacteriales bacterium]|nr:DUF2851 family protein [Flavobacteriales bacterium]MBK7287755.1 DUF2851 family protein [Flavobacteriales bacterium]QQS73855.1 MAG: DUF2851 family protein [Flavobacteriales bacterium]HQV38978.1 DUF2851 family protein [Flavobacteriales bacterium]HQW31477.1 DUF2851 family protein [Flavobacteriales bacterium]
MESLSYRSGDAFPMPSSEADILLDPAFPYGEDLLQHIWEAGLYDGEDLRTADGESLEVLKAGRIQGNSGPDLQDALVRIGEQIWAGNVEVHLRSSEWNAHGHQHDPAYNNVVLHAVYLHDGDVRTEVGREPPTVELRSRISERIIRLHHALMTANGPVPCASRLPSVDKGRIGIWLERLLVERLERKTMEVEALYRQLGNDPAETFHHMLLRGLGANVNAEPFGMLAHALPLKLLLKYRDDRVRTEALLFGQAGMLAGEFTDAHPRRLQEEHALLVGLHGLTPAPSVAWKFGRIRPANFPSLRIAQWAAFTTCSADAHGQLLEQDIPGPLRALLEVEADGYWQEHYRFDQASAPRPKRLGRSTADGLIINCIVPYLFAMGRIRGHQPWIDRALGLMEQLPVERNSIVDMWADLGVQAGNAAQGQALIELKKRYCAERKCLSCAIGAQLHKLSGIDARKC